MHDTLQLSRGLRRLNDLEAVPLAGWAAFLTSGERELAIRHTRENLPTSLLKHHDMLVAEGRRSIARVMEGACGTCLAPLPSGHAESGPLDVCDHCGVFLEWPARQHPALAHGAR